jgi:hypothetical protein
MEEMMILFRRRLLLLEMNEAKKTIPRPLLGSFRIQEYVHVLLLLSLFLSCDYYNGVSNVGRHESLSGNESSAHSCSCLTHVVFCFSLLVAASSWKHY